MNDATILLMVKTNLGIVGSAYDDYLGHCVTAAKAEIIREGASDLDASSRVDDAMLVIMYASWLWAKRNENTPMPRMLRYALNNRIFGVKMS